MRDTVPQGDANKPAQLGLFGFALKPPAEKAPARRPARKPPLRRCGARHWPKVCPDCLEQEARPASSSSQLSELPGETFEDIFAGARRG